MKDTTKNNEHDHPKILVVEDSRTQAAMLQHALEQYGYDVLTARSAVEGLAALKEQTPEVIISDIVMPEMDGYQFCRRIREDEKFKNIPVILLSSLTDPKDILEGLKCGANQFVTKPYDPEFLHARIQYTVANKELREHSGAQLGMEIFLGQKKHFITSESMQMIDLLISTFEGAVQKNRELVQANEELRKAKKQLEQQAEELHALSLNDELTKLNNRRGFLTLARQQLKLVRRNKGSLLLFFLDLDGLKKINDTFGHHEGDQALLKTAKILEESFRESDIIARIGGDEFAVLVIDAPEDCVRSYRTRLQENLDKHNLHYKYLCTYKKQCYYGLSLSIGVAAFDPQDPVTLVELMAKADRSMYLHKQSKRLHARI